MSDGISPKGKIRTSKAIWTAANLLTKGGRSGKEEVSKPKRGQNPANGSPDLLTDIDSIYQGTKFFNLRKALKTKGFRGHGPVAQQDRAVAS